MDTTLIKSVQTHTGGEEWKLRAAVAWSASDQTLPADAAYVDRAGVVSAACPYQSSLEAVVGVGGCPVHPARWEAIIFAARAPSNSDRRLA
jgi:hypothetical protein